MPTHIFKCGLNSCGRYYGKRYGYFGLLSATLPSLEQMDPATRGMKLCSLKRHTQSYMAITRPKNSSQGAGNLWRWYCYECNPVTSI